MKYFIRVCMFAFPLVIAGCDLLNQTAVIPDERIGSSVPRPASLARPDSILKLLTYLFYNHRPKDADEYGDLLYGEYIYRYVDPTDQHGLELRRDEELRIYRRIFAFYDEISAQFTVEDRWIEYGANRAIPPGTPRYMISAEHPDEDWVVLQVFGEMSFTYTDDQAVQIGADVRQSFNIAFRLDPSRSDSSWQIASWTDLAPNYTVKPVRLRSGG